MNPIRFVLDMVLERVPMPKVPIVVEQLMPTLTDLFQSEAVLTDDRRAELQRRVLMTLRSLGLEGSDSG